MSSPAGQCRATFTGTALATNRTEDRIQAFINNLKEPAVVMLLSIYLRPSPRILTDLLSSFFQQQRTGSSTSTHSKAGDAAFTVAAPKLWNALPQALKSVANTNTFKSSIKALLFISSF